MTCSSWQSRLSTDFLAAQLHSYFMLLGYNTNGLADVDAVQAIELVHSVGYGGIALYARPRTAQSVCCRSSTSNLQQAADRLQQLGMRSVIETGARFLLDPAREARADARVGRSAPAARDASTFSAGRSTSRPTLQIRLRFALVGRRPRRGRGPRGNGPTGRRPDRRARLCRRAKRHRWRSSRSRACSSTRWTATATCSRSSSGRRIDSSPAAADDRRRPSALPGRAADRRQNPPMVRSAGQRPHRGHALGRPRAPDVRRGRNRLSAGHRGPGRDRLCWDGRASN